MKDENFNDNQMQDENNRHEIIQKIRESADKEKIPESLNPENLDRLLEQGKKLEGQKREMERCRRGLCVPLPEDCRGGRSLHDPGGRRGKPYAPYES